MVHAPWSVLVHVPVRTHEYIVPVSVRCRYCHTHDKTGAAKIRLWYQVLLRTRKINHISTDDIRRRAPALPAAVTLLITTPCGLCRDPAIVRGSSLEDRNHELTYRTNRFLQSKQGAPAPVNERVPYGIAEQPSIIHAYIHA